MSYQADKPYWVYLVRCSDDTLYTGSAADVSRRIEQHNKKKGAKYTRSRLPVTEVYRECCASYSDALKREAAIKKLSRPQKLRLIEAYEKSGDTLPSSEETTA